MKVIRSKEGLTGSAREFPPLLPLAIRLAVAHSNRMPPVPVLRVARPTDDLQALLPFYCRGLGLEVLGSFVDHQGFDGVMLGRPGAPYHLELTHHRGHAVGRAPSADHLLVFYLPDGAEWTQAVERMHAAGFAPVPSDNPYWDREGRTFEDPDGYRVVLQRAAWPGE